MTTLHTDDDTSAEELLDSLRKKAVMVMVATRHEIVTRAHLARI